MTIEAPHREQDQLPERRLAIRRLAERGPLTSAAIEEFLGEFPHLRI